MERSRIYELEQNIKALGTIHTQLCAAVSSDVAAVFPNGGKTRRESTKSREASTRRTEAKA
jgi:hypothetical protein